MPPDVSVNKVFAKWVYYKEMQSSAAGVSSAATVKACQGNENSVVIINPRS